MCGQYNYWATACYDGLTVSIVITNQFTVRNSFTYYVMCLSACVVYIQRR